jgi:hypothetical protein
MDKSYRALNCQAWCLCNLDSISAVRDEENDHFIVSNEEQGEDHAMKSLLIKLKQGNPLTTCRTDPTINVNT